MEKTAAQWVEEAENFKSEFEASTGRQPTLEDVKAEIATIEDIENADRYAEELFLAILTKRLKTGRGLFSIKTKKRGI